MPIPTPSRPCPSGKILLNNVCTFPPITCPGGAYKVDGKCVCQPGTTMSADESACVCNSGKPLQLSGYGKWICP
jgi:hypothetical protein